MFWIFDMQIIYFHRKGNYSFAMRLWLEWNFGCRFAVAAHF